MKHLISCGLLTATAGLLMLTACGDDSTTNNFDNTAIESFTLKSLPDCSSENQGMLAFVKNDSTLRVCYDAEWFVLNGKPGQKGNPGDPGEQGDPGKQGDPGQVGDDGTGCTVTTLKDSTGLKLVCDGDSIGVIKHGKQGDPGNPGENGADCIPCTTEQLADNSGYKIVCGGDSVAVVLNGKSMNNVSPLSSSSKNVLPVSSSAEVPLVESSSAVAPLVESSSAVAPLVESSSAEAPLVESSSAVAPLVESSSNEEPAFEDKSSSSAVPPAVDESSSSEEEPVEPVIESSSSEEEPVEPVIESSSSEEEPVEPVTESSSSEFSMGNCPEGTSSPSGYSATVFPDGFDLLGKSPKENISITEATYSPDCDMDFGNSNFINTWSVVYKPTGTTAQDYDELSELRLALDSQAINNGFKYSSASNYNGVRSYYYTKDDGSSVTMKLNQTTVDLTVELIYVEQLSGEPSQPAPTQSE